MILSDEILPPATLISSDSLVHTERWSRNLSPFFQAFETRSGTPSSLDNWSESIDKKVLFTTDLSSPTTLLCPPRRNLRHIAISNSLDLMTKWGIVSSPPYVSALKRCSQIWVDTNWAIAALSAIGLSNARYVPWGLERESLDLATEEHSARFDEIVVPRVSSPHYNPELSLAVIDEFLKVRPKFRVTFLGMNQRLFDRHASGLGLHNCRVTNEQQMDESDFMRKLNAVSAVLMLPKTDGASISMLQALACGTRVVSSPTVGAGEWLSSGIGRISPSFSISDITRTLIAAVDNAPTLAERQSSRAAIHGRASLRRNVELALRDLAD